MCVCFATYYLAQNRAEIFLNFEHPTCKVGRSKPSTQVAQQFVNSLNSLLRRLRPKINPRRSGAARNSVAKIRLIRTSWRQRPRKGLISRNIQRGKPRQRYAPLTGAAARIDEHWREIGASPYPKYEPLSGAAASQQLYYLVKNRADFLDSSPSLCEQSELQCFALVLRLGRIGIFLRISPPCAV